MTIMKAIAMTALAGTILAGPTAAIAKSTEHGKSATAQQNATDRKTEHATMKAQRESDRAARKAAQQQEDTDDGEDSANGGKALGKPNFGTLVSGLRHSGGTLSSTDLTNLSDSFTVEQVDLTDYEKGQRMRAIDNALRNVDQASLQTTLQSDAEVVAALNAEGITDLSTVSYAYVDASGNLVVYTR